MTRYVLLALLAGYALPAFFPPPTVSPVVVPGPEVPLCARLFPGVPCWWMGGRLACLLAASCFAIAWSWAPFDFALDRSNRGDTLAVVPQSRLAPGLLYLGLALATAQLVSSLWADRFGRAAQAAYVGMLAVPSILLAVGSGKAGSRQMSAQRLDRASASAVGALVTVWLLWRGVLALHSPRGAQIVDMWQNFDWFEQATRNGMNLLTEASQVGVSNAYLFLLGISFLGPQGIAPSLVWLQAFQLAWVAVAAVGTALLAVRTVGPTSAPVATAVFLFSPFVLMMPFVPAPLGMAVALAVWLALLATNAVERRSVAAMVGLGALGGFATTIPQLAPLALVVLGTTCILLARGPRLPTVAWLTAGLCFVAAVLPGLPDWETVAAMRAAYVDARGQWLGLEALLLGQRAPGSIDQVRSLWATGYRGPFDVPLGSLLAPFGTPRNALRMWGDSVFDPAGAALAALGIAACARRLRGSSTARLLLAFLLLAVLPGALASAYDRASLTRNLALPVAIAVMSSAGFEWASRALWPRVRSGRAAAAAAIVVATGGTVLFDVVNPRILASSSMALILGALGKEAPEKSTLVLDHGDAAFHWLNVQLIARYLPASPLDVRSYKTAATLARSESDPRPAADLFFWSPGLEEEARISEAICERWPSTVLYRLVDTSGLSSAFAASPSGARWRPALPETQWHFEQCSGFRGKDAGPGGGT